MIPRLVRSAPEEALARQAAAAIIGPRLVGKATLALGIPKVKLSVYLDPGSPEDRARLQEPAMVFVGRTGQLAILDEIARAPTIFRPMRGVSDRARRARRIATVNLTPVTALEVDRGPAARNRLWLRGGFRKSLLASSDRQNLAVRTDFIRACLE